MNENGKLVRDLIPDIIRKTGGESHVRHLDTLTELGRRVQGLHQ